MRRIILAGLLCCLTLHYGMWAQSLRTDGDSVRLEAATTHTVGQWLQMIRTQGRIVAYNPAEVPLDSLVTLRCGTYSARALPEFLFPASEYRITHRGRKSIIQYIVHKHTLSGVVTDARDGESLIGVTLMLDGTPCVVTNRYGYYSLTLSPGMHEVQIGYPGYETERRRIELQKDRRQNFALSPRIIALAPVTVISKGVEHPERERVPVEGGELQPSFMGTGDIMNQLQTDPAVSGGMVSAVGLNVRGGNSDSNLVLFDGVPIYNYNHFTGMMSIFNSDAIKHVDFYKGLFPSRFVGGLSSVVDISMREGDMNDYHGGVTLDLACAGLFFEGPIVRQKGSFMVSARRSWVDAIGKFFSGDGGLDFSLHDLNLKANYRLGDRNRLYLSLYSGKDAFGNNLAVSNPRKEVLSWANKIAALRWTHTTGRRFFAHTTLSWSRFHNAINLGADEQNTEYSFGYDLRELLLQSEGQYFGDLYTLNFGSQLSHKHFALPPVNDLPTASMFEAVEQAAFFIENRMRLTPRLTLNTGINYSYFEAREYQGHFFQPRLHLYYMPTASTRLAVGLSDMVQPFHKITNRHISIPYELRIPAIRECPPAVSRLWEVDVRWQPVGTSHRVQLSGFYNRNSSILRYRTGQQPLALQLAPRLEDRVTRGESNGGRVELSYEGRQGRWHYQVGYAWHHFCERFAGINENRAYRSAMPEHTFKGVVDWQMRPRHAWQLSWSLVDGTRITLPTRTIPDLNAKLGYDVSSKAQPDIYYIEGIHNVKLPADWVMNLSYTYTRRLSAHRSYKLRAGMYNFTGAFSPITSYTDRADYPVMLRVHQLLMPRFLPYLSFSWNFL